MSSIILRTATRLLFTLLLLFALFILLRGHNEPGGGFIAGLVTAGAFVLYAIANDVASARHALHVEPRTLIATGLLLAGGVGVLPLLSNEPFLTGKWISLNWIEDEAIKLGTPVIFDVGVFLVVIGVTLAIILALAEE